MPASNSNVFPTSKLALVMCVITFTLGGYAYGLSKGVESVGNAFDAGIMTAMTNAKVRHAANSADITVAATNYLGHLFTKVEQPVISGNTATVIATLLGQQCELTFQRQEVSSSQAGIDWQVTKQSCKSAPISGAPS